MQNKNIIISVLVLVVFVVVGYVLVNRNVPQVVPAENANQAVQGKLNIYEVCQGALAYMTFPDGASADLFVEECKDGKHPQVIEQYKLQMGLGDGAAI